MGGSLEGGGARPQPFSARGCLVCDRMAPPVSHLTPEMLGAAERGLFPEPIPRWNLPRRSGLVTWVLLLTLPSLSFVKLLVDSGAGHFALATLCVYLCSTVLMALAAFSDPGTIPPNRDPDVRRAVQLRDPVEVTVRGLCITLKHCATCGIHRPLRAVHCRTTNRCVRRWDHYCPWIGNSVGEDNYPFFFGFVISALVLALLVVVGSVMHIRDLGLVRLIDPSAAAAMSTTMANPVSWVGDAAVAAGGAQPAALSLSGWVSAAAHTPLSCVLLALCTLSTVLLTLLLGYHVFLVSTNQTTYENVRAEWAFRPNPFDSGCLSNWGQVFGCQRISGRATNSLRHHRPPQSIADTNDATEGESMPMVQRSTASDVSATELMAAGGGGGDEDINQSKGSGLGCYQRSSAAEMHSSPRVAPDTFEAGPEPQSARVDIPAVDTDGEQAQAVDVETNHRDAKGSEALPLPKGPYSV